MSRTVLALVFAAVSMAALPNTAWAIAGFSEVASKGRRCEAEPGWPGGIADLVNDASRTVGWNFWFSECPNDVNHYAFAAKSTDDLNRLLDKLAAAKVAGASVNLSLGKEYPAGGFSFLKPGNGIPAVLAFGNQLELSAWYARLEEVEPGVRAFGVHRLTEPPTAMPPTLTIYVEHPAVDLSKLFIPHEIAVSASVSDEERQKRQGDAALEAIDRLLKTHRTGS